MALIVCPHCGNSISDTVSVCIHCGKSVNPQEEQAPLTLYAKLNPSEQSRLLEQFRREYPEYVFPQGREKAAKKRKVAEISLLITSTICGILFIIHILGILRVIDFSDDDFFIPAILLVLAIVGIIVSVIIWVIFNRSAKRYMHRFLLFAKLYQTWLSARNIKYKLAFRESEKKYKNHFNNINPILYMKEA